MNKILLLLLLILTLGCRKFLDIDPTPSQTTTGNIYSDDLSATSAVTGLYYSMMSAGGKLFNGGISIFPGLSADELQRSFTSPVEMPFYTNSLDSSNRDLSLLFSNGYNYIYQANGILESLAASGQVSAATKTQLSGEAKFIRAFTYFYLVNLFGSIPLITSTNYQVSDNSPRVPIDSVYSQIDLDLQAALSLLAPSYATGPTDSADRTRPNRWAAYALAARVTLFQQNWASAEALATSVIQSGAYELEPLDSVFLAASKEAIWQLQPTATINTAEGNSFIPSSASVRPTYTISPWLLNAFQSGDQRKAHWTAFNTISGTHYYYPYKYKIRSGGSPYGEYNMVLRLAELYLIRAEARAQQGDLADALADLDLIRTRAGLPPLAGSLDQAQCLSAVQQEDRIEFLAEWGHRWLDLKRWGLAATTLATEKGSWQTGDEWYPLPVNF